MTWRDLGAWWWLAAAPAWLLLMSLAWRRNARLAGRLGVPASVRSLVVGSSLRLRSLRAGLWLVGLVALVAALAGPRLGSRTQTLRKRGIDLVFVIDCSKSMWARDVRPDRIGRAKAELQLFLQELGGDRVGVVAFAGDTIELPLTYDYGAVGLFLRDLSPADMPVGGTAIGRAMVAAQRLLARARARQPAPGQSATPARAQAVVLLTDGEDHEGDPRQAAKDLAADGIRVYAVGIGSRSGEPVPAYADDGSWTGYQRDAEGTVVTSALSDAAAATLRDVAEQTGGRYIHAAKGGVGMQQVRTAIRSLKQSDDQARQVTLHEEQYAWPLALACLCFWLQALLPEGVWRLVRRRSSQASPLALLFLGLAVASLLASPARAEWFRSRNADVEAGNALMKRKDAAGALRRYDAAARKLPGEPGVHLNRGLALLAQKQYAKAREALLLATEPPASANLRADAYHNLGLAFLEDKNPSEAVDAFRRSLQARPGDRHAAWNLELALRRQREEEKKKQEEQAKQQAKKPEENKPEDKPGDEPGDKPEENKPGDEPGDKPPQNQPTPDQQAKSPPPADAQQGQPQDMPADSARLLDALERNEESLEQHRAKARAGAQRQRPSKDW